MTPSLESVLEHAARAQDWQREVVHRCAWCQRIATSSGAYGTPTRPVSPTTPVTDGMCGSCATKALTKLRHRQTRRAA